MKIRKKFLKLTQNTYPYGTESFLENHLPRGYKSDKFGNYYISVGDNYTTMFTCHLDTACGIMEPVNHRFSGNFIMTDGTTILGADDKAGMCVVLYMIERKVPGLYYFFIGEECGCVGSSDLADEIEKKGDYPKELDSIKKVVSFDRRGTQSVITDQFYGECCSNQFAEALCKELNYTGLMMKPDNTGVLTDSAQFMGICPECTNISVGYYDEHTTKEKQDIDFLYKLCKSVTNVNWESLPIEREPAKYSWGGYGEFWSGGGEWDDEPVQDKSVATQLEWNKINYAYVTDLEGVKRKSYISTSWIEHEKKLIKATLEKLGHKPTMIDWDGTSCWIQEGEYGVLDFVGGRSDLVDFIPTIMKIPVAHLRYETDPIF